MKRLTILLFLTAISVSIFAQEHDEELQLSNRFGKADRLVFDIYNDIWIGTPDSANFAKFNRGVAISLMKDFPFGESNFSFAVGLGFGAHNAYNNCTLNTDSNSISYFSPIKKTFKNNKISTSFIDVPIEFRFKTKRDNVFRVAIGGKIGYMVNDHIKYSDSDAKTKIFRIQNINPIRYGATLRVGYKMFNFYAYYGISTLFKDNKGPKMNPISIGISFIPF